ncbi:MAG TPA: septal ring lytic transglycosylase RlpA family protein [Caulobacteraceae bacterium]|jgi:rare lipoprotein A|nr:septal ring lytic transglycosylase RlpA family protein [Caulobacteraceae bacterium]
MANHLRRAAAVLAAALASAALAGCMTVRSHAPAPTANTHGTMRPYQVGGRWYYPAEQPHYQATGYASWYGEAETCRHTADGEVMDPGAVTGAHKTLPLPSIVEVTNLDNGHRTEVRINDRGPFVEGRIIDLSAAAAKKLGFYGKGLAHVRVRYLRPADPRSGAGHC